MQRVQLSIKKGFSLVELLVSISIFLVFVVVVFDVFSTISTQTRNSSFRERATILAEEGLEAIRNIRDANFANLVDGTHGLSVSGNQWNLSDSFDTTGIFTRTLNITTINENQKKVDVTISWSDQISPVNSFTLSTYLTNWRSVLNLGAGLTVNKSVINHGGSKVASDFAPYKVGTTTIELASSTVFAYGTYSITEISDPNYTQAFSGDCNSGGVITLTSTSSSSCIIINEEKPSYLTVTKSVINHGGTKVVSDFTLTVDSNPVTSGITNIFNSGIHTVSEIPDSNYISTISGDCNSSGVVTLFPTVTKNCIVTNEQKYLPILASPTATSISTSSAILGANVVDLGLPALISARGVCWGTTPLPVTNCMEEGGVNSGVFTQSIMGFSPNTSYYYRGYATNAFGTGYSVDGTFTTSPLTSTITFVGQATANGTTVTVPTHNVGDLIIIFAYRSGSNTPPTVPTGWTTINASGAANNSSSLAYKIATGSDSASGFSGANELVVQVYRGVSANPIGANNFQHSNSATVTYPALSLNVTNGTSWVIGFAGDASKSTPLETSPSGMIMRANVVGGSAEATGSDTNAGVLSWSSQTVSLGATVKWSARTLEIKSN